MKRPKPRTVLRAGLLALLLLAALAAWDGLRWWRMEQVNRQIGDVAAQTGLSLTAGSAPAPASTAGSSAGSSAAQPPATAALQPAPTAEAASGPKPPPLLPELQFAQAHALAARGALDAAINRYGTLTGSTPLGLAARYNSANLLLRQALELRAANNAGQALALLELAKEGLREVLRHDPQNWAARYNLERAQRLLPDPEAEEDLGNEAPKAAERSATTMRGYSPGLP